MEAIDDAMEISSSTITAPSEKKKQLQSLRSFLLRQCAELSEGMDENRQYRFINMIFNRINTNYISSMCDMAQSESAIAAIPQIPRIFSEQSHVIAEHNVVNTIKTELLIKARSKYIKLRRLEDLAAKPMS